MYGSQCYDPEHPYNDLPPLPPAADVETRGDPEEMRGRPEPRLPSFASPAT